GRLAVVVVDSRVRHAVPRLGVGAFELCDQVVECGHEERTVARQASEASSVTSGMPASAFETGQPCLAVSAASLKAASSSPGTVPRTVSTPFVIPSPGWNVTVADVS